MSAEEVAKAFVAHFYQTFDAGADALAGLFVSWRRFRGEGRVALGRCSAVQLGGKSRAEVAAAAAKTERRRDTIIGERCARGLAIAAMRDSRTHIGQMKI